MWWATSCCTSRQTGRFPLPKLTQEFHSELRIHLLAQTLVRSATELFPEERFEWIHIGRGNILVHEQRQCFSPPTIVGPLKFTSDIGKLRHHVYLLGRIILQIEQFPVRLARIVFGLHC